MCVAKNYLKLKSACWHFNNNLLFDYLFREARDLDKFQSHEIFPDNAAVVRFCEGTH